MVEYRNKRSSSKQVGISSETTVGEQTNKKRAKKTPPEQYEVGALDSLLEQWCCGAETQQDEQHMPKWKNRPHSFWLTTSTTLSPNTLRLFTFPVPGPEAMCLTRPSLCSNLFIATQHVKKSPNLPFFSLFSPADPRAAPVVHLIPFVRRA